MREFAKWLRRKQKVDMTDFVVFDAGCGNGKHVKYLVENFCSSGIGYDISPTAIKQANELKGDLPIQYATKSIGDEFNIDDESVDLVIDATSSHAAEYERGKFLKEISRVLKPGGYVLRTLAIEGDTNAKNLIKQFPGNEPNTYMLPATEMTERVFSKADLEADYSANFTIIYMEKASGYQKMGESIL